MVSAKGVDGDVTFDGRIVTIERHGLILRKWQQGCQADTAQFDIGRPVEARKSLDKNGFIEFTVPGGMTGSGGPWRTLAAASNDNVVFFNIFQSGPFMKLKDAVENAILNRADQPDTPPVLTPGGHHPPPPPPPVPAGWYPDPSGGKLQRYWDGTEWTEHTAPQAPE